MAAVQQLGPLKDPRKSKDRVYFEGWPDFSRSCLKGLEAAEAALPLHPDSHTQPRARSRALLVGAHVPRVRLLSPRDSQQSPLQIRNLFFK